MDNALIRNLYICVRAFGFSIAWLLVQILLALFVYSVCILSSENGLLSSYISVFPLALVLAMTPVGNVILLYLVALLPITYIYLGLKRAKYVWVRHLIHKGKTESLYAELIALKEGAGSKQTNAEFLLINRHSQYIAGLLGWSALSDHVCSSQYRNKEAFDYWLLDTIRSKAKQYAQYLKVLALLNGVGIGAVLSVFVLY
jgi:hypothetical protein